MVTRLIETRILDVILVILDGIHGMNFFCFGMILDDIRY